MASPDLTATLLASIPAIRPGLQTTECRIVLLLIVLGLLGPICTDLPPKWAAVMMTVSGVAYTVSRAWLKANGGDQVAALVDLLRAAAPPLGVPASAGPTSAEPAKAGTPNIAPLAIIAAVALFLTGCTTVYYPSGRKLCAIGSNVDGLSIHTRQISVTIAKVDNGTIHRIAGDTVSKAGVAVATSGILGFLGGIVK